MNAAILAIGDELVSGERLDTNSAWLAQRLGELGVRTIEMRAVDDDRAVIAQAVTRLGEVASIVIATGGLGPTEDDLTRDALGDVIDPDRDLEIDRAALRRLEAWFRGRRRAMPVSNRRQAMRPPSARLLDNPHGTAPGLAATTSTGTIFCLPGPPREMKPMFETFVAPLCAELGAGRILQRGRVHAYGIGESDAAQRLGDLMARDRDVLVGTTVTRSILTATVRAHGTPGEVHREVAVLCDEIAMRWAPYCYGRDGATLAETVVGELRARDLTLATAESCTGGWLGKQLVDVSGSSAVFRGGWVTYSNEMKTRELGVDKGMLGRVGAVSAEVAAAMARGATLESDADLAVSITGIAGPDGGTSEKPVGTVFVGVAGWGGERDVVHVRRFRFPGDRDMVRDRAVKSALQMLRFALDPERSQSLLWERGVFARAWIALGANLGDRAGTMRNAIDALEARDEIRVVARSTFLETKPVGGAADQPLFLNAAVEVETCLEPRTLLEVCLEVERSLGRVRDGTGGGPRTIDLDLLLYVDRGGADRVIDEPGLVVPHPRLHERTFVLDPMTEIAPDLIHPVLRSSVQSLRTELERKRATRETSGSE